MTSTQTSISEKLQEVQEAIKEEDTKIQQLEAIEKVLQEVLEGEHTEEEPTEGHENGNGEEEPSGKRARKETIREIVLHALEDAGRPVTIPEVAAAAKSARGKAVRQQGLYSTLAEMAEKKEIKRVRPGLYKALAGKN